MGIEMYHRISENVYTICMFFWNSVVVRCWRYYAEPNSLIPLKVFFNRVTSKRPQKKIDAALNRAILRGDEMGTIKQLRRGANVDKKDILGYVPLHRAVLYGHHKLIKHLIKYGADIDEDGQLYGYKPLHLLAHSLNKEECLEELLKYDVDLNSRDCMMNTILLSMVKLSPNDVRLIKKLLSLGLDPNSTNIVGNNCLHILAASHLSENPLKLAAVLLKHGTELNCRNISTGETPLHTACRRQKLKLVDFFLREGADMNILDRTGEIAMEKIPPTSKKLLEMWSIFVKHFILREHRGELTSRTLKIKIESDQRLKKIYRDYESELERLKKKHIKSSHRASYYDILCKSKQSVSKFMKNEEIQKRIYKKGNIPSVFNEDLHHRYEKVMEIVNHEQDAFDLIDEIFHDRLPYLCVKKISTYITPEDLEYLSSESF